MTGSERKAWPVSVTEADYRRFTVGILADSMDAALEAVGKIGLVELLDATEDSIWEASDYSDEVSYAAGEGECYMVLDPEDFE